MTTFDQALAAGDADAVGYRASILAGNSTGAAAGAATLTIRYPGIVLPVIAFGGPGQGDDVTTPGTLVPGVDDQAVV